MSPLDEEFSKKSVLLNLEIKLREADQKTQDEIDKKSPPRVQRTLSDIADLPNYSSVMKNRPYRSSNQIQEDFLYVAKYVIPVFNEVNSHLFSHHGYHYGISFHHNDWVSNQVKKASGEFKEDIDKYLNEEYDDTFGDELTQYNYHDYLRHGFNIASGPRYEAFRNLESEIEKSLIVQESSTYLYQHFALYPQLHRNLNN